ncbi:MAG: hypothetical protein QMD46_12055 [Methanomicrobiales archaeon]|nr:hypothetical protein [Methanomicrobiales archaeon]MDI6876894.1 hypothetical protein [Methanomicrobiales archaeon]
MERGGLYRTLRERIRERRDIRGLMRAFADGRKIGDREARGAEEAARSSDAWVSRVQDRMAVSVEAEDLLGRIGDARSLEPLLRLKAVEEKA